MGISKFTKGQVWFIRDTKNYDKVGCEQLKSRPYIIISGDKNNFNSQILQIAPIATRPFDKYPFHVYYKYEGRDQLIEVEQSTCISVERMKTAKYMYSLDEFMMDRVDKAILIHFGIYSKYMNMFNEFNDMISSTLSKVISEFDGEKLTTTELISFIRKVNQEANKSVDDHSEVITSNRSRWTEDLINSFLKDSKVMTNDQLAEKYQLKSGSVAATYKYKFMRKET